MTVLYPAEAAVLAALRKAGAGGLSCERLRLIVAAKRTRYTWTAGVCGALTIANHIHRIRRKTGERIRGSDGVYTLQPERTSP